MADKAERKSATSKFKGYVARPEVKELYITLRTSAKVIDGASKTLEILSQPWVKDRLPSIAGKVAKLTKFAKVLGPAGAALGVGVDVLAAFGLVGDAVMDKLDQISRQIEDLRDDLKKGFEDVKRLLDRNLALQPFLTLYLKLQAQVEIYEQHVGVERIDATNFSNRLADMTQTYKPDDIIHYLKQIHDMITGKNAFGRPLFEELARGAKGIEGKEFDDFMWNLFCQFQAVIALEIRVVRMLRSFLAYSEKEITYGRDVQRIFEDLGIQRHKYDPVLMFQWYLDFMRHGGNFRLKALKPDKYLYMEWGNHRVSGTGDDDPGPKGHFHLKPCGSGAFRVSCKYYPGEFMQLRNDKDDADVMSAKDENDLACQWYFHIVDMDAKVFKLSTAKWPDRYVYMQDEIFAEVRGCDDLKKRGKQVEFQLL